MTDPKKPYDIAIVGGGIAGIVLTIGLLHHSIPVTLYESASKFGEIGAGVAFGPNATRAMSMIDPQIKAGFDRRATQNQWASKQDLWFTFRVGDERKKGPDGKSMAGELICDLPCPPGRGSVHRAHFLDEMVKLVPQRFVRFGKKLVDIKHADEEDGSSSKDVILHFADGTTARHSAVIGCDGIKSRTREIVLGENDAAARAKFSGKYAYRGLIPMDQAIGLLGDELATNSHMYFGYHGHVLTFPVEKGKTMNVVAFNSRDSWDDPNWVVRTTKEEMLEDFKDWGKTVRDIITLMQKPDIWALFSHPPAKTYYRGHICLVGDAAHASTPHQGAGAGMAIEDALIMSTVLAEVKDASQIEKAFQVYDHVRRERSQRLVKTSLEQGTLYDFELVGDDLDKVVHELSYRNDWVWNIDHQAEVDRAKKAMRELANL